MISHYSETELDQYRNGDFPCIANLLCRFHLLFCKKCKTRKDDLAESDNLIKKIQTLSTETEKKE